MKLRQFNFSQDPQITENMCFKVKHICHNTWLNLFLPIFLLPKMPISIVTWQEEELKEYIF